MTDTLVESRPVRLEEPSAFRPFLPALVVLFVGSGCAALIYEIVWLQLLGLVIGASAISLGVLLGTFMGGMCIGSLAFPKLISRKIHPLLVYGALEFAIGMIGLLEPWLIRVATDLYTHLAQPGAGAVALRSIIAAICLLPPTILMGATLPAIARYVESTPRGVSWLGFFYGGNIVGAVIGCLTAGFYLLPNYDMKTATLWAVVINVSVAALAGVLALLTTHRPAEEEDSGPAARVQAAPGAWSVYLAIAISGMTGLGAEVVWTRQLSLMLGATVYTFSNILAVFLLGLGIGSSVGSFIARSVKQPRAALGWCQLLLAGAIAWAAYSISYALPFWPVDPVITADKPFYTFQLNLAQCFWAVLPGALLWGASFPLALAGVARCGQDPGKLVGGVYAANTVGAILGSMLFTLVIMPQLGSQNAQRLLVALCVISGIIAILPLIAEMAGTSPRRSDLEESSPNLTIGTLAVGLVFSVIIAGWLVFSVGEPNWNAVAWGRRSAAYLSQEFPGVLTEDEFHTIRDANVFGFTNLHLEDGQLKYTLLENLPDEQKEKSKAWLAAHDKILTSALGKRLTLTGQGNTLAYDNKSAPNRYCVYLGEGMNVSVAVTYDDAGNRYFHGAGKVQASSNPADMRLQRSLGHISALTYYAQTKKDPKDVLVVACGAGVTAGSFVPYNSNITIVDIEKMVPYYVTPQFADVNHDVIPPQISHRPTGYPKTNVIIDDGRHFIRTSKQKFDVITSDPIDPWVKGCAALNTVEYYQMCKEHLNPGGIMALWIPLYESSEDTTKSVIATFFKVFPNGIIWSNDQEGQGYDAVLFGSVPPAGQKDDTLHLNIDDIQAYLDAPGHEKIKQSIADVGFGKRSVPGTCEAVELLATFAGTAPRMSKWIETPSAETKIPTEKLINYDSNLRLQYVAGLGVNRFEEGKIFSNILRYYSYPEEIFTGSPEHIAALKEVLSQTGRREQ